MDLVDLSFQALKSLLLHGHSNQGFTQTVHTDISTDCTDKNVLQAKAECGQGRYTLELRSLHKIR